MKRKEPVGKAVIEPHQKRMRDKAYFDRFITDSSEIPAYTLQTGYFLDDYLKMDSIQKKILQLRKFLKIPKEGEELSKAKNVDKTLRTALSKSENEGKKKITLAPYPLRRFIQEIPVEQGKALNHIIALYVVYNAYHPAYAAGKLGTGATITLMNLGNILTSIDKLRGEEREAGLDYLNEKLETVRAFPIQIALSEKASQRQVVDYVRNNWKHIEPLLKEVPDTSLEKTSSRERARDLRIRERNILIYENAHLPLKEILKVLKELGFNSKERPDEGGIGKIISKEKISHLK